MVILLRFLVWLFGWTMRPFRRRWQPGQPIRCLIVGYGGANNTGAEGRTVEAIRQMLDADPRISITLTSLDRGQTLRYLDETDRLRVYQFNPVFIGSILKLVLRTDLLVLIEGSCFKENFSSALLWFFMYAGDLAERFGIPTVTYGVDAGPLSPANRRWAHDVAKKVDLLMVRTEHASRALRAIDIDREIIVTTDTAFTLVPETREWAEGVLSRQGIDLIRPVVGIAFEEFFWWPVIPHMWKAIRGVKEDRYKSIYYHSWGRDGRERSRRMKEQIAAYADWICKEFNVQVVFFAMERLDIGPCQDVQRLIKSKSILIDADHYNARQIASLLQRLDWLVTCRYHALVFSMGGGVPIIGLAHDERIETIMEELGLAHEYLISHEETRVLEKLKDKTQRLGQNAPQIRSRIQASIPLYLTRMDKNERHFARLVQQRFPD